MPRLGVNIDHVATLRQARGGREPDPVWAAVQAELGGADGITIHLREDRRHIQDRDLRLLRETVQTRLNLEMSVEPAIVAIALEVRPDQVTLVPERRAELTTEGGLDVVGQRPRVGEAVARLRDAGLEVSLFIDPEPAQVEASRAARRGGRRAAHRALCRRRTPGRARPRAGGPGDGRGRGRRRRTGSACRPWLNYGTSGPVAVIAGMAELNIGHSIVSRRGFRGHGARRARDEECLMHATIADDLGELVRDMVFPVRLAIIRC